MTKEQRTIDFRKARTPAQVPEYDPKHNSLWISVFGAFQRGESLEYKEELKQTAPVIMRSAVEYGQHSQATAQVLKYSIEDYENLLADIEKQMYAPPTDGPRVLTHNLPSGSLQSDLRKPHIALVVRGFLAGRHNLILRYNTPVELMYSTPAASKEIETGEMVSIVTVHEPELVSETNVHLLTQNHETQRRTGRGILSTIMRRP